MRKYSALIISCVLTLYSCKDTKSYNDYLDNAYNLLMSGDTVSAINTYTEVIKEYPEKAFEPYKQRAICYYNIHKHDYAIKSLDSALAIDKSDSDIFMLKGNVYFDWGKHNEAISCYHNASDIDSNNIQAILGIARGELHSGNYIGAFREFTKALRLDSTNCMAIHGRISSILVSTDHYPDKSVFKMYSGKEVPTEKIVTNQFDSVTNKTSKIDLTYQLNLAFNAEKFVQEDCDRGFKYCNDSTYFYNSLGAFYYNIEEYSSAVKYFTIVNNMSPNDTTYLESLGFSHLKKGNQKDAYKYLNKAKLLGSISAGKYIDSIHN